MRPAKLTPAHTGGDFAELVCSNSLRASALENAVGLLKEEMRRLGSLIMACADDTSVPAGGALAVDRSLFAGCVTEKLHNHPLVEVIREEAVSLPEGETLIIATGPLTSDMLSKAIRSFTGEEYLYFYDAVAPIVLAESINMDRVFRSSRYGKGEDAYLNCPFDKEEYERFWEALVNAEKAPRKSFERELHFEGCMPVEALAARGKETLLYGPMKPVGLVDPRTGRRPYAVVQLRQENNEGTMYNLVGFQTSLKWDEQRRVLSLIPGLEKAEIARFGVMHRNTYINSPVLLNPTFQSRMRETLFFAGQLTGVEGYVESAAAGLVAGINAARILTGQKPLVFPRETAHGSLAHYITTADPARFQPMNINFGLLPPADVRIRDKKQRYKMIAQRALDAIDKFKQNL
ncbi:Methylenetetrahydrofolate--tRNA-(uracil-5-)-methyltransferase TrmFO [Pelotomaculum propionicicum]|uniref:Methylenetetrahydrofolate--tRNA-(uracil-5-)-methyltransferase TrmFO n=2 Tax=Pelotomaculum propionicicum TaxID=258475 RepID=A0A4Y7RMX6_9FIRM|nr:Methylenetetrahydrofolate--tRNA-(uracil-5-)-methyltransferase TrmFO [Pelotomaculum propionicicum]